MKDEARGSVHNTCPAEVAARSPCRAEPPPTRVQHAVSGIRGERMQAYFRDKQGGHTKDHSTEFPQKPPLHAAFSQQFHTQGTSTVKCHAATSGRTKLEALQPEASSCASWSLGSHLCLPPGLLVLSGATGLPFWSTILTLLPGGE